MINMFKKGKEKQDEIEVKEISTELNYTEIVNECKKYFIKNNPAFIQGIHRNITNKDSLKVEIKSFLMKYQLPEEELEIIVEKFNREIGGYGIIDELIDDDDISDIKLLSKENTRIKKLGKRYSTDIKFSSDEEYESFIDGVVLKNGKERSDINAIQVFTDKDSNSKFILRIDVVNKLLTSNNSYMHIRKIPKRKKSLEELVEMNMLENDVKEMLVKKIKEKKVILFAGQGGSGKTTLMNALIDEIPHDHAGVIIQESEELFSYSHPELMEEKTLDAKGEGRIEYSLRQLAINGLLTDIDWFIIGEIKGAEGKDFITAAGTDHGCLTSLHSSSAEKAIDKLIDYAKYETDYSREDLLILFEVIDCIVFMDEFKVKEISEVVKYDYDKKRMIYNTIYNRHDEKVIS